MNSTNSSKVGDEGCDTEENALCDENSALQFFKQELQADCVQQRLEAIRNIKCIAACLDPTAVQKTLIPYIDDIIVNCQSDEMMCVVAEVIPQLCDFLGEGSERYTVLCSLFRKLLACDESIVRVQAWKSFASIMEYTLENDLESEKTLVIEVAEILFSLGNDSSYSSRISACFMCPKVYKMGTITIQRSVLRLFKDLCCDEVPLVQMNASANLLELSQVVDKSLYISFIMPHIIHFWKDEWCDEVRIGALYSCIALLKGLSQEDNISFSLPLLLSAVKDGSWQIRLGVAKKLDHILLALDTCDLVFQPHLSLLLKDSEPKILISCLTLLATCIQRLSPQQLNNPSVVSQLCHLAAHSDDAVRCGLADVIVSLTRCVETDQEKHDVFLTIHSLLNDSNPHVRLKILDHGKALIDHFPLTQLSGPLVDTISSLLKNPQRSIRLNMLHQLTSLAPIFNGQELDEFESLINTLYFSMFSDKAYVVRSAAQQCIATLARLLGYEWVNNTLLTELLALYTNSAPAVTSCGSGVLKKEMDMNPRSYTVFPSYLVKITVLQSIPDIVPLLSSGSQDKLGKLFLSALKDKVPNVRFSALRVIGNIIQQECDGDQFSHLLPIAESMESGDEDVDVRYYASEFLKIATGAH